jgi:predicted Zn-dependent peptidase
MMALYADGDPGRADEMLAALQEQARDVTENGFSDGEVQRVKNRRRTNLALEGENPRARLMHLVGDIESYGRVRSADDRFAAVDAVTAALIASYLERHPITGDGLLLSAGPRDWP